MRKLTVLLLILLTTFSAALLPYRHDTAQAATFDAGNLISDPIFTAKDAMSVGDIQAFLQAKGSVLTRVDPSTFGAEGGGRSAAQIIWDSAHAFHNDFDSHGPYSPFTVSLNPQVLLSTLQKESSLITGPFNPGDPVTQNLMDWAMGMGCPDGSGCNSAYKGFANQVNYGAAQFYLNFLKGRDALLPYHVGQTYTISGNQRYMPYCDGNNMQVTMGDAATVALYYYTPHVCNGNANFWLNMNNWFTDVFVPYVPTLARPAGQQVVYILRDGTKYPIDSADTFMALNLDPGTIRDLTPTEAAYPTGAEIRRLVSVNGGVYWLENGMRRSIPSIHVFNSLGYNWGTISDVGALVYEIPIGMPMYYLARQSNGAAVFAVLNGRAYPFDSADTFQSGWGMSWGDIGVVPSYVLSSLPQDKPISRLVIQNGSGPFYVMENGMHWPIDSLDTFFAWKFDSGKATIMTTAAFQEKSDGPTLTRLIRGSGATVYYVDNGTKRPIDSIQAFNRMGFNWGNIRQISDIFLNTLPTGSTIR